MPNEPLGISFSPFNRQRNGPSPTNYGAPAAPMLVGLAASAMVGGTWFTVMVMEPVTVPPGPVTVATKVVVCAGVTVPIPDEIPHSGSPPQLTGGLKLIAVALVVTH